MLRRDVHANRPYTRPCIKTYEHRKACFSPWWFWLCCQCCRTSRSGQAGPYTPLRPYTAACGTTTSGLRWRLEQQMEVCRERRRAGFLHGHYDVIRSTELINEGKNRAQHYLHGDDCTIATHFMPIANMNYQFRMEKIKVAPAAYFYNVNVTSAVHGADPTAGTPVQSAPWTAPWLCSNPQYLWAGMCFLVYNMITVIFTGAKMYSSYLFFFFILIRLM